MVKWKERMILEWRKEFEKVNKGKEEGEDQGEMMLRLVVV